ncbi:MAG: hypothetical protein OHK0045_22600 [Raineya sp.]
MEERCTPSATTSEGKVYIVDLRTQERLAIQFLPEELNISRTVNIQEIGVVARNNPRQHWVGGKKEISFTFFLLADDDSKTGAKCRAKWLESLTYQDTTTGKTPQVILIWGRQYRQARWVVSRISFKEKCFVPEFDYLPQWIEVSINLSQDNQTNERVEDIRENLSW